MSDEKSWTMSAVGDVFLDRENPEHAFARSQHIFQMSDLVFGNCEGVYTEAPHFAPSAGWRLYTKPENAVPLRDAGFDVMSLANNHTIDAGYSGLSETVSLLAGLGIKTIGAGSNAREARRPVCFERGDARVGFLAYSSVYPPGYEAKAASPGLAALRIHSHYYFPDWDAYGHIEPGVRPHVRTFPYPEDLDSLRSDIRALKDTADLAVVSFHWGVSAQPAVLTDYERTLAHCAIDSGADVILGHHHHYLRAVEIYKEKPIFYGLGHFGFTNSKLLEDVDEVTFAKIKQLFGKHGIYPRDGYPLLPFHPDARMTMIAVLAVDGAKLGSFGLIPCMINADSQPVPVSPDSPEWDQVLGYMNQLSQLAGLETHYRSAGEWAPGVSWIRPFQK